MSSFKAAWYCEKKINDIGKIMCCILKLNNIGVQVWWREAQYERFGKSSGARLGPSKGEINRV